MEELSAAQKKNEEAEKELKTVQDEFEEAKIESEDRI